MVQRDERAISSKRNLLMERNEFINEVFAFFRTSNEDLKRAYDLAFTTQKRVDWNKLYLKVIQEAESRYLPTPKWFVSKFDSCLLPEDAGTYKINGGTGVLKLAYKDKETGEITKRMTYEYDMSSCPYTLAEIKAKFRAKFKEAYEDFVYYPAYYKVVGNTVIDTRELENAC